MPYCISPGLLHIGPRSPGPSLLNGDHVCFLEGHVCARPDGSFAGREIGNDGED